MKTEGVYLGFHVFRGRVFLYGNLRTTGVLRRQNTDCRKNEVFRQPLFYHCILRTPVCLWYYNTAKKDICTAPAAQCGKGLMIYYAEGRYCQAEAAARRHFGVNDEKS